MRIIEETEELLVHKQVHHNSDELGSNFPSHEWVWVVVFSGTKQVRVSNFFDKGVRVFIHSTRKQVSGIIHEVFD